MPPPTAPVARPVRRPAGTPDGGDTRHARHGAVLLGLVVLLGLTCLASLAWGARDIAPGTVLAALTHPVAGSTDHAVVLDQRLPRTVVGLLGGAALGLSGALMQGITRNPIADPGLLGVTSGASLAVVVAISVLGVGSAAGYVWFAFLGAAIASVLVYGVAAAGGSGGAGTAGGGATPVRLALVGAAFAAVTTSLITLVLLTDLEVLEQYRYWSVGSLTARDWSTVTTVAPFLALGALVALTCSRFLDATALGDDVAQGLGQHLVRGRTAVVVAVVLLCGGATALVGPIAFVGLMVPHVARALVGPAHVWVLPYSAVLGPVVLLVADVVGRLVVRPSELEAGLVVAVIGAPVLVALVRRSRAVSM